jgi:hypothetical protein
LSKLGANFVNGLLGLGQRHVMGIKAARFAVLGLNQF